MADILEFNPDNPNGKRDAEGTLIHCYTLNKIPMAGVSSILKRAGLVDLSGIPAEALERAKNFGKAVHVACEYYDKGTLDMSTVDNAIVPYLEAWQKFVKVTDVKMIEIEQPVYSKRYWYAGTPDRIATVQGDVSILDLKSSSTIYPSMPIQLAAYKIASEEMKPGKIKRRIIIQLLKTGEFKLHNCTDDNDMNIFLCAVQTSKWIRKNLKKEDQ